MGNTLSDRQTGKPSSLSAQCSAPFFLISTLYPPPFVTVSALRTHIVEGMYVLLIEFGLSSFLCDVALILKVMFFPCISEDTTLPVLGPVSPIHIFLECSDPCSSRLHNHEGGMVCPLELISSTMQRSGLPTDNMCAIVPSICLQKIIFNSLGVTKTSILLSDIKVGLCSCSSTQCQCR